MNPNSIWTQLSDPYLLIVCVLAVVLGAIGAAVHPPPPPSEAQVPRHRSWDIAAGGVAAFGLLYVTSPTSAVQLVAGSLVAGYAANAVLASLSSRVTALAAAAASGRAALEANQRADATAELARSREDTARRMAYALDELARAADRGGDVRRIVQELRATGVLPEAVQ